MLMYDLSERAVTVEITRVLLSRYIFEGWFMLIMVS